MYLSKIKECLPRNWEWQESDGEPYKLVKINANDFKDLRRIKNLVKVERAYRIESPFLYAQYLLKKDEYVESGDCKEKQLYHCTAQNNVNSIANINLDFRRVSRVKYGKGVSFSPSAAYANKEASHYCGLERAMLICDVLIGKCHIGDRNTFLPLNGYDTTQDIVGNVYVKYYDDEFYPKYAIYYSISKLN